MSNSLPSGRLALVLQPVIQYGFAGLSVLLLAMICWMQHGVDRRFDNILELQRETNQVIERNTAAIQELSRLVHDKL